MSRKQFLAELGQYLTFVSPEQRDEIVAYYNALLDNAGPNGEARILEEVGTPMKVAIALKRRLEANEQLIPDISDKIDTPYFVKYRRYKTEEADDTTKSEEKQGSAAETAPVASVVIPTEEDSPSEATSKAEVAVEDEEVNETEAAPKVGEATEAEAAPKVDETTEAEAAPKSKAVTETEKTTKPEASTETEDRPEPQKRASAASKASIIPESAEAPAKPPMTFGRFMTAIGLAIASVVIVAFFALITAIGGIIIASAVDIIISGFDQINYLSDRLMILGCGALITAFGILLIWFAVWVAIRLIKSMVRSFNKTVTPEKGTLKYVWKIIWIIVLVFVVIAVICGGVSLFMGGDPLILGDNEAFSGMLSKLSPTAFVDFFKNSGLFG